MNKNQHRNTRDAAAALAAAWQCAEEELDSVRIRALRRMSETESAQRFARLICPPAPYPLRESSGLVEQQRIFSRLRVAS